MGELDSTLDEGGFLLKALEKSPTIKIEHEVRRSQCLEGTLIAGRNTKGGGPTREYPCKTLHHFLGQKGSHFTARLIKGGG